ncbi:hypothetical protein [Methylobacterium sp. J-090]|uniref:hypothetical protein n=1 Tax=Methylobacterium sp. J-090 TaxID=2836666 RepID=UPI001FBBD781|nr:hypothetical protein [Methylobacterium sp. J-090]MCJ2079827.1 hypothetical protein [Methylobacterium sp. J-090]
MLDTYSNDEIATLIGVNPRTAREVISCGLAVWMWDFIGVCNDAEGALDGE